MGELSINLGEVSSRFVEEMVYGISSSGSVRLTEVSRALEEDVSQHATHKRLSRNLAKEALESTLGENVLKLRASRIKGRVLFIVVTSWLSCALLLNVASCLYGSSSLFIFVCYTQRYNNREEPLQFQVTLTLIKILE